MRRARLYAALDRKPFLRYTDSNGWTDPSERKDGIKMKYVCNVCGWVYDEEEKGVKWEDLPEDFACELCGVGKDDFTAEE